MPIVEALGNLHLDEDHWKEIKEILNTSEPLENRDFTLGQLIQINVQKYQEEIVNVSITAS